MTRPTPTQPRERLLPRNPVGLDSARTAPFWQGARAERIVAKRVKGYQAEKAAKLAKAATRKAAR